MKYPEYILHYVRANMGYNPDDKRADKEIEHMSKAEVFRQYLEWEGIIGYTGTILGLIEDIYGIQLEED